MKLFGHPSHRIAIVFPLGVLATSFFFDVAWTVLHHTQLASASFSMIVPGVIGGVIAAVIGFAEWRVIAKGTRARRIGALHGAIHLLVILLFAVSWLVRRGDPGHPTTIALLLSAAGVGLSLFGGWLGGELVDRTADGNPELTPGVAVDRGEASGSSRQRFSRPE